jgi:ribonuclease VapC
MARIVVDTSAVYAILRAEPDSTLFKEALSRATELFISSLSVFECKTVLWRRLGIDSSAEVYEILRLWSVQVVPFNEDQLRIAYDCYRHYGRGSGHKAQLNYGDCAAYSLTRLLNAPLLFKGKDFIHTDIIAALPLLVPEAGVSQ